tara:strand:- start:2361 stop:3689 length:1329 start_codon:yes stop_codon:yes gene_type:complete
VKSNYFDNLPLLQKDEAISILRIPLEKINRKSDYYKAAYHLSNYPCTETEQALIELLNYNSDSQAILIAKRIAITSLSRINSFASIPLILKYLNNEDPYLVENAALALNDLNYTTAKVIQTILSLLENPSQNRRTLLHVLIKMKAFCAIPKMIELMNDISLSPSIRGASAAGLFKLSGNKKTLKLLKKYMFVDNQNNRHCAVNDIIIAEAYELLPDLLRCPVSPTFRINAIDRMSQNGNSGKDNEKLKCWLDSLLLDNPNDLIMLKSYKKNHDICFLIEELFNPDFAYSYLALKTIINQLSYSYLWQIVDRFNDAKKDYGALYFFLILLMQYKIVDKSLLNFVQELALFCLSDKWSQYMKFRPVAITLLIHINPLFINEYINTWIDDSKTLYWFSRYAALHALGKTLDNTNYSCYRQNILIASKDNHRLVRIKALSILNKYT